MRIHQRADKAYSGIRARPLPGPKLSNWKIMKFTRTAYTLPSQGLSLRHGMVNTEIIYCLSDLQILQIPGGEAQETDASRNGTAGPGNCQSAFVSQTTKTTLADLSRKGVC